MAYCPKCRAEVGETVNFCRKCGYDLKTVEPEQTKPEVRGIPVCSEHPERDAVGSCSVCGKYVCSMCRTILDKNLYCPSCVEKTLAKPAKTTEIPTQASAPRKKVAPIAGDNEKGEEHMGNRAEMTTSSAIMLLCGILVLVGVFLPWLSGGEWYFGYEISGWSMMDTAGITVFPYTFFVIAGSTVMIVCATAALILSLMSKGSLSKMRQLGILATVAAAIATTPALCGFIVYVSEKCAGYGLYLSTLSAVMGVIVGLVASMRSMR